MKFNNLKKIIVNKIENIIMAINTAITFCFVKGIKTCGNLLLTFLMLAIKRKTYMNF